VEPVLGPDRRGVVVVGNSDGVKEPLARAGLGAVSLNQVGLALRAPVAGSERAAYAALAVRRPAVDYEQGGWAVAAPDGVVEVGADPVPLVRAADDREVPPRLAVFGGAWIRDSEPEYGEIHQVGGWLAGRGAHLVCGGYQGAMAAASQGVKEAGGIAVGVTVREWEETVAVNEWLTHELVARDLFSRLPVIADADAWVAFPGGVGTLQEVALCWHLVQTSLARPRPLLIVGEAWDRQLRLFRELLRVSDPAHFDLVRPVASYDDVVEALAPAIERP
jgi:uncharacterized protein (TIGR00730 family)